MQIPPTAEVSAALDFLEKRFHELDPRAVVYRDAAKLVGRVLTVYLDYGKTLELGDYLGQVGQIEREWNDQHDEEGLQIFLLPAGIPPDA